MKASHETRPEISTISSGAELKRWYWRKDELVAHARTIGVKRTGGKFLILDRIAHFLDTSEIRFPGDTKQQITSAFDWHKAALDDSTVITDSYRNSQNVRRYFKSRLGTRFTFNIAFMEWMRANTGKTLGDACKVYPSLAKVPGKTTIKDHNQFNQYTRDFLADNPKLGMDAVRRAWAAKIKQPSKTGRHRYERADRAFVKQGDSP